MEDEDGTCLLDVLCDPQALNDFLHGTSELQNEDLLISSSSGDPSLFTDAPSPVSLLADDPGCQDPPAAGCVDLSFLEEALLESPEAGPETGPGGVQGDLLGAVCEEDEDEEQEEACDILRQSLEEADITEQTLALEAGLAQPDPTISLYPPGSLIPSPATPFLSKPLTITGPTASLPRDTQAAVEPPQPSLLAVGPGCPSLKPAASHLMGLLPGNVFPAPSPETSFSLSPVHGSGMLIQKAVPSITGHHVLAPTTTAAPGILLQRGPLHIQPKLPVSIQPRLVQISPKPVTGQKQAPGLTFIPGTTSPNILLTSPPVQSQAASSLPKQVSLQLVNQAGSIVIQPHGLFQNQNQLLLPAQTTGPPRQLLTQPSPQGPSTIQGRTPATGHLVDASQILTVPQQQLNFSPVFTTPTGQLALRQGAVLSGPLQLQSAPPAVFQMPAQLAGAYAPQGQGQHGATVLHGPALGNHITLINSSGMLTQDMTSISIVNGPSMVQRLPFTSQAQRDTQQLSLPQGSVLLLPERTFPEERTTEEHVQHTQSRRPVVPNSLQSPAAADLQPHTTPPVVTLLQPLPDSSRSVEPHAPLLPSHLVHQPERQPVVEGGQTPTAQNQIFMQHLQQQALKPSGPSAETQTSSLPVRVVGSLSPPDKKAEAPSASSPLADLVEYPSSAPEAAATTAAVHCVTEHSNVLSSPPIGQTSLNPPTSDFLSEHSMGATVCGSAGSVSPQAPPVSGVCGSPLPLLVSGTMAPQQQLISVPGASAGFSVECRTPVEQHPQPSRTLVPAVATSTKMFSPEHHAHPIQSNPGHSLQAKAHVESKGQIAFGKTVEREEQHTVTGRHRILQQLCSDHAAVLNPQSHSPFVTLEDVVRRLLPYHTCAGKLPGLEDFASVDEQFQAVSGLLLSRTKDMQNKYRQLLLGEAQQVSPSAEMVMLERLFLQSERFALGEERRRARRDPEGFLTSLRKTFPHNQASSAPDHCGRSGSPSSPPAWAMHSDRPPGLKTYCSSSRGALRLTIKQESGSRKVVRNSACETTHNVSPGYKRHHSGELVNGREASRNDMCQGPPGTCHDETGPVENTNGPQTSGPSQEQELQEPDHRASETRTAVSPHWEEYPPSTLNKPEIPVPSLGLPLLDPCSPNFKQQRLESPITEGQSSSPSPTAIQLPPPPGLPSLQEDSALSEHLQSAIDSILELQRLQSPGMGQPRLQQAPGLEPPIGSMLQGRL
ncbi:BRD4-interacting chromatin-remodeling complex-associated protein isoform X2 [Denticeps clupeoides]|uniref:BRD4-interacting chromatin-remodeling complex-associated protein isoform X2 n=1 Tax=Denticeps clupeoides TaxID=299321 RepID=UPI0010A43EB9|nr:BRD4-interacting chromatin-remodeling complex-associated protein-like isoform X2 [Denticeps clupeoides]